MAFLSKWGAVEEGIRVYFRTGADLNAQLNKGLTGPASAIVGIGDAHPLTNKWKWCSLKLLLAFVRSYRPGGGGSGSGHPSLITMFLHLLNERREHNTSPSHRTSLKE